VPRAQVDGYHSIRSGPMHGVNILRRLWSGVKIVLGIGQAWALAGKLRPSALFLTGGWATFPVAVGCWLRRIPVVIYMPDIEPAQVIRITSRFARLVMTPVPESANYFPASTRTLAVGYPLRDSVVKATREAGIARFGLDPARKTLLVWGGSRGAQAINNALAAILPEVLALGWQIVHISGTLDWPAVQARHAALPADQQAVYHVFPYLEDIGLAFAAADLTVSRAGASTLGEYPHFGLPSILVPLAFAWRYQQVNADWLASRGAALRVDNEKLSSELLPAIRQLSTAPAKLGTMHTAALALKGEDVSGRIARELLDISVKR